MELLEADHFAWHGIGYWWDGRITGLFGRRMIVYPGLSFANLLDERRELVSSEKRRVMR